MRRIYSSTLRGVLKPSLRGRLRRGLRADQASRGALNAKCWGWDGAPKARCSVSTTRRRPAVVDLEGEADVAEAALASRSQQRAEASSKLMPARLAAGGRTVSVAGALRTKGCEISLSQVSTQRPCGGSHASGRWGQADDPAAGPAAIDYDRAGVGRLRRSAMADGVDRLDPDVEPVGPSARSDEPAGVLCPRQRRHPLRVGPAATRGDDLAAGGGQSPADVATLPESAPCPLAEGQLNDRGIASTSTQVWGGSPARWPDRPAHADRATRQIRKCPLLPGRLRWAKRGPGRRRGGPCPAAVPVIRLDGRPLGPRRRRHMPA